MNQDSCLVSVCMITYNHEKYIKQAIEGVLEQKTSFSFKLIIGEDCSTDNTRQICIEYKEKYPDIIELILQKKNTGMMPNFIDTLKTCTSKYIALCEGDDFWTDPYKLQKQVDFMEKSPSCAICYTNAAIMNGKTNKKEGFMFKDGKQKDFSLVEFLSYPHTIPTLTVVFRKQMLPIKIPDWVNKVYYGDVVLFSFLLNNGEACYLDEATATYRSNVGVISKQTTVSGLKNGLVCLKELDKHFDFKYHKIINKSISEFCTHLFFYYLKRFNVIRSFVYFFIAITKNRKIPRSEWARAFYNS